MTKTAVILGCGYTGKALACQLRAQGYEVRGSTRNRANARALEALGIAPVLLDTARPETLAGFADGAALVFDMIPPRNTRGAQGEEFYEDDTHALIRACAGAQIEKFVYLGSTAVYGNSDGAEIDEETPVSPASPRARARVEAEEALSHAHRRDGFPAVIVRAPGIYGPGRSLAHRIRRGGYRVPGAGRNYVNRIHVHDLAQALLAAALRGRPGALYLASDDCPEQARAIADFCAKLLGLPPPPAQTADEAARAMSPSNAAMMWGNKRLSNRRIKEELGVVLRYPSYREGIPASIEQIERS